MNFNPAAAVSVLINHNHHLNHNINNNNNNIHINNNNLNNPSNGSDIENFHQFDSPLTPLTNHTKSMEWTNDDALELIEQYRGHTELWNRGDPKYKDKLCRFRAWSEIAERFGCSKAEVERKMNVLLTQYRREKHKMLVKLYQGVTPSPSKWYAFKRFDFMESGSTITSPVSNRSRNDSTTNITNTNNSGLGDPGGIVGSGGNGGVGVGGGIGGTNGHTIAAAALNELRNFETTTSAVSAAAAAAAASSTSVVAAAAAAATHHHHQHHSQAHRRFKTKEMKYFGAMGLNLPMLIANTQNLDTWNSVGQFSPPIGGERGQLRVPLPMAFGAAPTSELGQLPSTTGGRSIFGGGSSSSELTASPQKPMETTDIDDEQELKHEQHSVISDSKDHQQLQQQQQQLQQQSDEIGGGGSGIVADDSTVRSSSVGATSMKRREGSSSPIANTNIQEAHTGNRPPIAHPHHRLHDPRSDQEDLDIKEELVDYFHAPHPPAPPGSHRSYSSTEERIGGGGGGGGCGTGTDSDDFAQDLRISAAAVAAAAKTLDFSRFVLPRNLRQSTDSNDEEKFIPLNMRKLSGVSGSGMTPTSAASAVSNAGQMLMSSLLSHESLSEDTLGSGRGGGGGGLGIGSGAKSDASNSAAAAAAALYAESLNKDDCDFIGSNVSLKLRAMDRDQRIIAEKLISEVLFFGQFNELERTARIQPK